MICSIYHIRIQPDPVWHRDLIGSSKPMQESFRGADHGSDLRLHVYLYAGNCSEHVCTLLIGYRSGGTPGFDTSSGRVMEIAGRRRGSSDSSALVTSRLFVLPVVARRWVSVDNSTLVWSACVIDMWALIYLVSESNEPFPSTTRSHRSLQIITTHEHQIRIWYLYQFCP